jgi:predicted nucleic acid-binding protein
MPSGSNVIVVDASALTHVVADGGPDGTRLRNRVRSERLAGPDLLRVEVVSALRRQQLHGSLTATQARHALDDLLDVPLLVYPTVPLLRRAWDLRSNLTAYDACYVALAEALDCPLLTMDRRLADAPGPRCRIEVA